MEARLPSGYCSPLAPNPSYEHGGRCQKCIAYDLDKMECNSDRIKPTRMVILDNRDIDQSSKGKNTWDEAVQMLVLTILDLNVVD